MKSIFLAGIVYLFLGILTSVGLRGFWSGFIDPYEDVDKDSALTWREVIEWPRSLLIALSLVAMMIVVPLISLSDLPHQSGRR